MNTEATTLAPQTRQMLGEAAALTEGQGKDWLGKVMLKDEFMAAAQDYLNRAGLQRIEYSILMRFAAALERTLFTWRGPELALRLEAQLCRWMSRGLNGMRMQKLAVHCWEWVKQRGNDQSPNPNDQPETAKNTKVAEPTGAESYHEDTKSTKGGAKSGTVPCPTGTVPGISRAREGKGQDTESADGDMTQSRPRHEVLPSEVRLRIVSPVRRARQLNRRKAMSTRKHRHRPGDRPRGPGDAIRRIVAGLDCDPCERDRYVTFAFELSHAITKAPVPEFEEWAKKVVMKWFVRGLSGYLMRQIGDQLIRESINHG